MENCLNHHFYASSENSHMQIIVPRLHSLRIWGALVTQYRRLQKGVTYTDIDVGVIL